MTAVDPDDVTALLDATLTAALLTDDSATRVVELVTVLARSYTRGNGFTGGEPNAEIAAVITLAAARLAANASQLPSTFTRENLTIDTRGGFAGWSVAELAVLNRYRVRAQ